ncbi:MAG: hypothetical protein F4171_17630 [Gammaproteobacteria bacterium]|nr:hypothetical protein [Gammaproteobacteria bacterium]MYK28285.1 hypothetical protein [Gammaproteobacteria bacterium]
MQQEKRIYCVEGVHDWGNDRIEPTVEPMLALLQKTGYWPYQHRTCATIAELKWRLQTEWWDWCKKGSVLYFSMHGYHDQIWLRPDADDAEVVGVLTLKEWLDCTGCHVHFGGCDTFSGGKENLRNFMESTGAVSVSGYATEADWLSPVAPALALELLLFGLLHDVNLAHNAKSRPGKLRKIEQEVNSRFGDCEFRMLIRGQEP